jgi:DNA repair protein RecO (recombination protein O)
MSFLKTEAIVLKSNLIGETDKIVTLLTKRKGKLQAVAKGARRAKSSMLAATYPLSMGNYVLFEGQNYYYIDQWELIHSFVCFEENLLNLSYATFFTDLVYKVLQNEQECLNIYNLLKYSLLILEKGKIPPDIIMLVYVLKFVSFMGYMPELNKCSCCGNTDKLTYFSFLMGGVVCNKCKDKCSDAFYIKENSLNTFRYLLKNGFNNLERVKISGFIIEELDKIISGYIKAYFEKAFETKTFLNKIKNM